MQLCFAVELKSLSSGSTDRSSIMVIARRLRCESDWVEGLLMGERFAAWLRNMACRRRGCAKSSRWPCGRKLNVQAQVRPDYMVERP